MTITNPQATPARKPAAPGTPEPSAARRSRIVRWVLRATGVAIAVIGLVDPVVTLERPQRRDVTVVALSADDAPLAHNVASSFGNDYRVAIRLHRSSHAAACPSSGGCVVVSDGRVPARVTAGASVIGGVRRANAAANIVSVEALQQTPHVNATATLRVRLRAPARVEVLDAGVAVGQSAAAGTEVDVEWTPIAAGARHLRVIAEQSIADVGVVVRSAPVGVMFLEPEPSWLGTFVRRALDDDGRFRVSGSTRVAPRVDVGRGERRLTAQALGVVNAVALTSPELLGGEEVDLLEQFVRQRGGSVLVLLDRAPSGAMMRLLPAVVRIRAERAPLPLGPLRAAELAAFDVSAPGVTSLVRAGDDTVVASRAIGRGRVVVSGAMDAWRHRDGSAGFNAFWTGLMWEASMAAGDPLRVMATQPVVGLGDGVRVSVERQSFGPPLSEAQIEGSYRCGDAASGPVTPLRFWPDARRGSFVGRFAADQLGKCTITTRMTGMEMQTEALVVSDWQPAPNVEGSPLGPPAGLQPPSGPAQRSSRLEAAIAAHGGIVVEAERATELVARAREQLPPRRTPQPVHPMRSPWWLLPFTACLSCEWWLRRRRGLA